MRSRQTEEDVLLTTKQVANRINSSTSFLEKGRVQGYGPAFIKICGAVRYRVSDVEEWLSRNTRQPGSSSHG
jgi:predicted DNA-binding transcriptional regulator AlpA